MWLPLQAVFCMRRKVGTKMEYRAVGNRCAVDLNALDLPITNSEATKILLSKGFNIIDVDLIKLARDCIGKSKYRRGARPSEAPEVVDCSSLMKWLYGQRGIWLPRRSIQQRELGETVKLSDIICGDVVFVSGRIDRYINNSADGVGHVGIATNNGTIIHAMNREFGIVESKLEQFVGKNKFRGVKRYIPKNRKVITFQTPEKREIEISDDIRWVILQTLSTKK